jgi:hypothetical protein
MTVLGLSGCGNADHSAHSINEKDTEGHEGSHQTNDSTSSTDTLQVNYSFAETTRSGKDNKLTIQVNDESGNSIQDFELEHEKLMHLIIVSEDLSYFDHIHPEYQGNGEFIVSVTFPSGGKYKLFADFVPKGSSKVVNSDMVQVEGDKEESIPLKESSLTQLVDEKEVTLSFDHMMSGMNLELNFNLKDNETNEPISDLQPYLGAVGHVVIISADTNTYLHVHPMEEKTSGPDAKFMTNFPKPGIYKIWGQFKQNGTVITVPFIVNVPK